MNQQQWAKAQGLYDLGTGLWPLLHRRSFLAVTGSKTDWGLVQTVGWLALFMMPPRQTQTLRLRIVPQKVPAPWPSGER